MRVMNNAAAVVVAIVTGGAWGQTFFAGTGYLSAADSPFVGARGLVIEDFEDGLLNVPGVSVDSGIVVGAGLATDSVDGDDGLIDGLGQSGRSLLLRQNSVTISFGLSVLGGPPSVAGVVITDIGQTTGSLGFGDVLFEVFDFGLGLVGSFTLTGFGDGSVLGGTAEDRFVGVRFDEGIGAIRVTALTSEDWELDHIQYGDLVPGPGVAGVLVAAGLAATRRRR